MSDTMRISVNKYKFLLKILLLALATALISAFAIAIIYEGTASKSILINTSKRIVAEAGAIVSGNPVVSKNIMNWKDGNEIPFGPEETAHPSNIKSIDEYVKKDLIGVKITGIHNYDISEHASKFQYEDLTAPQLKFLREKYDLDKLTVGPTEMDRFIILRNWIKNTIQRGRPKDIDYNFNAIDILARAGKGETFFCSEYSTVFVQCALSLGFQARYVGLFKGHAVAEVWSNQFAKWIVMDVDNNLHYEMDGEPLSALELHRAFEDDRLDGIHAVCGPGHVAISDEKKKGLISYYHEFFVRMRNDWFSHKYPHWHHKGNSIMNSLEWQDGFTGDNMLVSQTTGDEKRLYFPIDTVSLRMTSGSSQDTPMVIFDTFTPSFSHFLVGIDAGRTEEHKSSFYKWHLHKGVNQLKIRAVNLLGVEGPESYIKLELL